VTVRAGEFSGIERFATRLSWDARPAQARKPVISPYPGQDRRIWRLARAMQFAAGMMKHLTSIVLALALTSACGSEAEQQARGAGFSSDCGGYGADGAFRTSAPGDGVAGAYCDASMLYWTYDEAASTLRLRHTRIEMNCGAIPGVDLWLNDGVFQIVEKEVLEDDPYGCQCVFDIDVRLEDVPPDQVPLEVWQREHHEKGKGTRVWAGTLDVTRGDGELVVDASETHWCDQNRL
jgi:hypothetical protein